ncbi:MAG TPA: cation diffusion facilitator family transporter [Chryseosolibacter sp.]|jgi:cation diffusion facilitator family transporter|nr:cation diffusion facilitator family transporter [Chryseosolibacter sp.]
MEAARENIGIQKWVAAVSVLLLFTKLAAYYLTGSVAILTDALESIVNVVAGFFGLYSLQLSAKPKDPDHPYGHGKIEFISAAVEGVMISFAAAFIVLQAITNLVNPVPLHRLDIGIILVFISGAINFVLGTWCIRTGTKNNSLALLASGQHLHSDTYTTVGILAGLALLYFTGIAWLDSAVALLFAGIIFYTGFRIIRSSVAGIMDKRDRALLEKMIDTLDSNRSINWVDIHNIRIIKYGSTLHIDCHLTVPWYLNVHEAHGEVDKLANLVRKDFGDAIELFVHTDGCLPISCPICIKDDCPVRYHPFHKRIKWTVQNMERDKKHEANTR